MCTVKRKCSSLYHTAAIYTAKSYLKKRNSSFENKIMQAKAVFKWQGSLLALFQGDQVICPGLKGPKINHSICSCLSPFLVTNTQPLGWFLRHDSGKGRVGSAQILNTFFRCCTRTNNEENVNTGSGGWQGTNTDCHPAKVLVLLEFTLIGTPFLSAGTSVPSQAAAALSCLRLCLSQH